MADDASARWQRIERLYHQALEYETVRRAAFLDEACRGDDVLKREVESLLGFEHAAGDFLERPALADAAQEIARDAPPRLTGRKVGGYDVTAPLGVGGMGEVYRSRDMRLGREVALKVLEPSIAADPVCLKRFEEEARSASVLNHPNIVTIYGVGEDDGIAFIAMELVQGRTLREYIAAEPLPIKDAIDIAAQMAGALTAAHANGIVHRDLKPENVMVTPEGLVKVLDFGIAKRQGQVSQPAPVERTELRTTGSQAGSILGTVGYMSPEQAAGKPATFASDQFSFGTILYEMLSGRRAFQSDSKVDTLAAIIGSQPPPVETLNPRVPAAVRRLLERCLAKAPEARYSTSRDLESELVRIKGTLMPPGISRRQALSFGAATAAAAVTGVSTWWFWPLPTLAVLPFSNTAHDDDIDYLCIGLTENLISRLRDLPISVKHFSLVSNFAETTLGPREVGRQLGVGLVLTGNVKVEGPHTLISAELINVATGTPLWTGSYDRAGTSIFAIWDALAEAVVDDGLHLRLSRDEKLKLISRPTKNPEAYTSFLRARPFQMGDSEKDYLDARDLLKDAVARDPGFAEAWLALGHAWGILGDGYIRPSEALSNADYCYNRAQTLNPSLPDLHFVRAGRSFREGDWPKAEREWRIASAAPDKDIQPEFLLGYAKALWAVDRPKDSLEVVRRIRRMDPISPLFMINEADYLFASGQLDAAARMYRVAIHADENDWRPQMGLAEVFRAQGQYDAAIVARRKGHELHRDDEDEIFGALLATAAGQAGYEDIEQMAIVRLELPLLWRRKASGRYAAPLDFARAYARLGNTEQAFKSLREAIAEQAPALKYLDVDRAWDKIRADSRFQEAVQRVHLRKQVTNVGGVDNVR